MEILRIDKTDRTPSIYCNHEEGALEMSGRSIPENAISFYKLLFDWLDSYVQQPNSETQVVFNLEYFNTSSSKCILDILRKLEKIAEGGSKVEVKWYFDEGDEDMEESGNDFKSLINLDIELVAK
jgi:SiaC family regulatory phosphoprotein